METWTLLRAKRSWVPEAVWRFFCRLHIADCWPFAQILTAKPQQGADLDLGELYKIDWAIRQALDALESDATLHMRQDAFSALQDLYEPDHLLGKLVNDGTIQRD